MNETVRVIVTGKEVEAELLKKNPRSLWVRLKDGNIIKRKRSRQTVDYKLKEKQSDN